MLKTQIEIWSTTTPQAANSQTANQARTATVLLHLDIEAVSFYPHLLHEISHL